MRELVSIFSTLEDKSDKCRISKWPCIFCLLVRHRCITRIMVSWANPLFAE